MQKRIVVIGAGPVGVGAAVTLNKLGHSNWAIYEKNNFLGGLASSVKDLEGFTWDIGGHVIFSHYADFDLYIEEALEGKYLKHQRNAYISRNGSFVPYPFQNNIRYLPENELYECLRGLINRKPDNQKSDNFKDWILSAFGEGIAKYFMFPQNLKTWTYPLEKMSKDWMAERISVVDIKKILENIKRKEDDSFWGPNNQFKFPLEGGTGGLFEGARRFINDKLFLNKEVARINLKQKKIYFSDGSLDTYDYLINSMPLNNLCFMLEGPRSNLKKESAKLKYNGILSLGIGFKGKNLSNKTWVYFPEKKVPFYRMTYLSNYSPKVVPDINSHFSLLCEISIPFGKKVNKQSSIKNTLDALVYSKIITRKQLKDTISLQSTERDYSYPIPTLERDAALKKIHKYLESVQIYSRGRFGGWKYEIGNMDHSFMQGLEAVKRILRGLSETVWKA